jgi:hypothetical protein
MRRDLELCAIVSVLFLSLALGCGNDAVPSGESSCNFDSDCPLGTVCQLQQNICITASCEFCTSDQICYRTAENPEGSCSAPECIRDDECAEAGATCQNGVCGSAQCVNDDDCADGETCTLTGACVGSTGCTSNADCADGETCDGGSCVAGCTDATDCQPGQVCLSGACTDGCDDSTECDAGEVCSPDNICICTQESCPEGQLCNQDTGACETAASCDTVNCPDGQHCDEVTMECIADCAAESCPAGQICNPSTGECEVDNCLGSDPTICTGEPIRNLWDSTLCACVECLSESNCDTNAGETCSTNGSCVLCATSCASNMPGTCMGTTPYCIGGCCVQCIGNADCSGAEICIDGSCGAAPDCTQDPNICPMGTTCVNGVCESQSGGSCDPANPASCPSGQFCDPMSMTCISLGGGMGCGFCNEDCTCPGNGVCDGTFCSCAADTDCPPAMTCGFSLGGLIVPGTEGVCFPQF